MNTMSIIFVSNELVFLHLDSILKGSIAINFSRIFMLLIIYNYNWSEQNYRLYK